MQKGVPEHEAAPQHPAPHPWHGRGSTVTPPVPLSRSPAPGDSSCSRGAGQTRQLQPYLARPQCLGSVPPVPAGMAATPQSASFLPPAPRPTQLHTNQPGPSWDSMFKMDLAETHGASRHGESELGEDSPLCVQRGFLACPGSTECRVLGH